MKKSETNNWSIISLASIYILDKSGVPYFARYYKGMTNEDDSVLLGGFLSAIEIFVRTSLKNSITDVGMNNRRFYFHRNKIENIDYLIVASTNTKKDFIINENDLKVLNLLFEKISLTLQIINNTAKTIGIEPQIILKDLGTTIDSFLFESSMERLEDTELLKKDYSSQNFELGKAIDPKNFVSIVEKIKTILDEY